MRILHLCKFDFPERGGVEKVAHELCVGLSFKAGLASDMLAMSETMEPIARPYTIFRGNILFKLGSAPVSPAHALNYIKKIKSYDIVHLHHPDPFSSLLVCLLLFGKKLIVHWHSDIIRQKYSYILFRFFERRMLKQASAIIVTSPPYALSSKPLRDFQHKINMVPIGIEDCANETINAEDLEKIRSEYSGRRVIFSLGRLIYYKGFEYLIAAAQFIPDDAVILIGGSGVLQSALQDQIDSLGLAKKVKLLGHLSRSQCLAYYKMCDIFCMSSTARSEAFGVVQLEAMCFSKPLISTRIAGSGVDWVNMHGESGFTVAPESGEALGGAISQLLADDHLLQEMGAGARKRFDTLFSRERMVDTTHVLYTHCLR